jgi:GNAT superfamily N-acetyltransferase
MPEVFVREATEADIPAILKAHTDAGIDGGASFTVDEARTQLAQLREYPSYRIFVAESEGEIAGTYALIILDNLGKRGAKAGVVEDVAVVPTHQRKGIGLAMMAHAREECRAAGCYKLTLSSGLPRESAHRFYESLGFERHGYSYLIRP